MEKTGINHKMYCVKDELSGKFLSPVFHENDELATRWFKYLINNTDMWRYNAAMYTLYRLGTLNDVIGLTDYQAPELIAGGVSVLDKE